MSRWTHGLVTNSRRKMAALHERPSARAGVDDVAVPAVHVGAVLVDERQLPVALAGARAAAMTSSYKRLRRPERTGDQVAQRPPDGARERRDVDEVRGARAAPRRSWRRRGSAGLRRPCW